MKLGHRHRSTPLQTYYIEQQVSIDIIAHLSLYPIAQALIGGDKKVLFER